MRKRGLHALKSRISESVADTLIALDKVEKSTICVREPRNPVDSDTSRRGTTHVCVIRRTYLAQPELTLKRRNIILCASGSSKLPRPYDDKYSLACTSI